MRAFIPFTRFTRDCDFATEKGEGEWVIDGLRGLLPEGFSSGAWRNAVATKFMGARMYSSATLIVSQPCPKTCKPSNSLYPQLWTWKPVKINQLATSGMGFSFPPHMRVIRQA